MQLKYFIIITLAREYTGGKYDLYGVSSSGTIPQQLLDLLQLIHHRLEAGVHVEGHAGVVSYLFLFMRNIK